MKKILIIYTGGTIGMHHNTKGALKPFDFGTILKQVPELNRLNCVIHHHQFEELIDSSNINRNTGSSLLPSSKKNINNTMDL